MTNTGDVQAPWDSWFEEHDIAGHIVDPVRKQNVMNSDVPPFSVLPAQKGSPKVQAGPELTMKPEDNLELLILPPPPPSAMAQLSFLFSLSLVAQLWDGATHNQGESSLLRHTSQEISLPAFTQVSLS